MGTNDQSILTTTKRTLGLAEDYTVFDQEVILHINSVFSDLHQLGVGPLGGFEIMDSEAIWADFLGEDLTLSSAKSYMFLRVKLLFDPPTPAAGLNAIKEQIEKHEWRLTVAAEPYVSIDDEPGVYDGGVP